jgi:hypothetical protein
MLSLADIQEAGTVGDFIEALAADMRWITQRASREDLDVRAEGDPRVLSALRELKVF